jgi:hypothetical protein
VISQGGQVNFEFELDKEEMAAIAKEVIKSVDISSRDDVFSEQRAEPFTVMEFAESRKLRDI